MASSRARPIALVTGASSGIGAAYAERLAQDGYDLILVARRRHRLELLAERLGREAGAECEPLAVDHASAFSQLEARVAVDEGLALLVNSAGFGGYRRFIEVEPQVINALIDVHVRAVARLTRAAVPGMVRRIAPCAQWRTTTQPVALPSRVCRREGVHAGLYRGPFWRA